MQPLTVPAGPAGPAQPRPGAGRLDAGRTPAALLLVGLIVAALSVLPIVYLAIRAAGTDADALAFLLRPRTIGVLGATVALGAVVGIGTVLLGLPIAWLTTRTDLPARRWWTILTVVPLAIPSYVLGFAFVAAFGPRGAVQSALQPLGVERLPDIYGLPGAATVLVLAGYPYVVLAVRAGMLREDRAVEEAARTLGDTRRDVFRRVTLPLLGPAIAAGTLLAVLYALSDFGAVSLLQFDSFSRAIYLQYRATFDRSLAALLALVLLGLTFAVTWGEARVRGRARAFAGRPVRRPVEPVELGRWRWPAVAFLAAVVGLALVVPAATIAFWLIRAVGQDETFRVGLQPVLGSLGVAAAAALAAAVVALPVGLLLGRHPGRFSRLVERVTYGAFALPGIVIALALVFLATTVLPVLYQTLVLLVVAYAVRFLAEAVGPVRATLVRTGLRLEEAGRTLGDGPVVAFAGLTLPVVRPAVLAGAALVFLSVVKELPMALILGPIGFQTLATEIWSTTSEGFYARAAGPAAVLLVLSAGTMAVLLRDERP